MKRQFGVQVVWADPVEAGAVLPGHRDEYVPDWQHFDHEFQADSFASLYTGKIGSAPMFGGVKEVNRGERWAVEEYTEWEVS